MVSSAAAAAVGPAASAGPQVNTRAPAGAPNGSRVQAASSTNPLAATTVPAAATLAGDPVIAAGGDIACRPGRASTTTTCQYAKTATLINSWAPVAVLPLGDTQYDSGATTEYAQSYNPTWGVFKAISHPAVGNHEYMTTGASGYYGYFGASAGDPSKGYYSYNINGPGFSWHIIALNTECSQIGGCGVGSAEEVWLKNDLAANKNVCTLAYSHRPRFSSGATIGSDTTQTPFFQDLYNGGADLFLSGHAHHYERFAPMTASGALDTARGVTQFIVGASGDDFQGLLPTPAANSIVRQNTNFGALKLTLHANTYDFQFVPDPGYTFTDSGSATCHNAPAGDTTKPSAPTNVTATAPNANQVNLSWTAATDNVGVKDYQIYRGSNGATPSLLATTTTNAVTYTDSSVIGSTPYTYQVYAEDAAGNIGPASNTAAVTTPSTTDTTPPSAPTLSQESIASNEIDLGWTVSTDTGTGVSGYKLYRQGPGESSFTLLATQPGATNVTYADKTVKPSSNYLYYVTAFDGAALESAQSNTVTSTTPAGPTSKTFTFTTSGDATIQQANPTSTGGTTSPLIVDNSPVEDVMMKFSVATTGCETLTSAKLTLTNNADGSVKGGDFYTTGPNWTESAVTWSSAPTRGTLLNSLGAVASGATATVDVTAGVTLNGEADFRIGTTSSDGVHYYSKEGAGAKPTLTVVCAASAPAPDTQPPTAPANLTGNAKNSGEVDLSWAASNDNVGVTAYDIYRDATRVGTVPGGPDQGSSLTYQDTSVSASTTYNYTVKALDAANNTSPASNTATVTTPAAGTGPSAPTNLTATATSSTSVNLAWAASNDPTVTGYNIYRGPHGGTLTEISSSGTSSFTDTTVAATSSYDYQVTAVDTGGNESPRSGTATVTTPGGPDTTPPTPPAGLSATAASSTSVNLKWTASTDDTAVTGYTVYRAPTGSPNFAVVGTTGGAATTFTDSTVVASTSYDYQVKAFDAANNISAASNTASVTTPPSGSGGGITAGTAAVTKTTTAAAAWTVNLPTYAAGDFMVVWLGNNLGSTAGTPSSAGWTAQVVTNESSGLKGTFLTRRMAAGDPSSITVTWGGSTSGVAEAVAFTGVNATTPVDAKAGQAEASTTAVASHVTPSITTTAAGDVLVSGFTTDNGSTWSAADPELADATSGTVSAAMYLSAPVAVGSNAKSATATTASVKAVSTVLALKPA